MYNEHGVKRTQRYSEHFKARTTKFRSSLLNYFIAVGFISKFKLAPRNIFQIQIMKEKQKVWSQSLSLKKKIRINLDIIKKITTRYPLIVTEKSVYVAPKANF